MMWRLWQRRSFASGSGRSHRCGSLQGDLSAYVDGELDSLECTRQRCRVEAHLEHCSQCAETLVLWAEDAALLSVSEESVPASPWFVQQVAHRVSLEQNRQELSFQRDIGGNSATRLGRWLLLRSIPIVVTAFGLLIGIGLRVQFEGLQRERTVELSEFEAVALARPASSAPDAAGMTSARLDEILRPLPRSTDSAIVAESADPGSDAGIVFAVDTTVSANRKDR